MATRKNPAATAEQTFLDPDALPASDAHPSADAAALDAAPQPPQPTDTAPTDAPAEPPTAASPGPADLVLAAIERLQQALALAADADAAKLAADAAVERAERVFLGARTDENLALVANARSRAAIAAEAAAIAARRIADARAAKEEAALDEVRAAAQAEAERMVADLRTREAAASWAGFRARVDPHVATLKSLAVQLDAVVAQINSAVQEHNDAGQDAQNIARKLGGRVDVHVATMQDALMLATNALGIGPNRSPWLRRQTDVVQATNLMARCCQVGVLDPNCDRRAVAQAMVDHGPIIFDQGRYMASAAVLRAPLPLTIT